MNTYAAKRRLRRLQWTAASAGLLVLVARAALAGTHAAGPAPHAAASCTAQQRRAELRAVQEKVLAAAPLEVDSLADAVAPRGPLAGWRLSHGLVVIAGGEAVPLDNLQAKDPLPPLLLYAPSPDSSPDDWLDFDGDDGPYRLVGWGYLAPYEEGEPPPPRPCIEAREWALHEAGWHLRDGGMLLTPGAKVEPPPPDARAGLYFWHPRAWSIHFWRGDDGVPTVAFDNPRARAGGVRLPDGAFRHGARSSPEALGPPDP